MGRILRVGFAMGGGVSMGTFSGVALGEALKLLVLYGGYEEKGEKIPYDDIVVDIFSGASAGALSLLLMLRALAKPEPKYLKELGSEQKLRNWLKALHPVDPVEQVVEGSPRWKKLLAAQYVQDLQRELWIKKVNIKKLCDPNAHEMATKASLFDRGVLERICADYFAFKNDFTFTERSFLPERVLFACTLSNLSPITFDARRDSLGHVGSEDGSLTDVMTSSVRKDMRVFDLWFDKPPDDVINNHRLSPKRWFRYYAGVSSSDGVDYGNLASSKAWARIASTAIACGCFPLAFEPVVLPRKHFEYPPNVWKGMFEGANHLSDIGLPEKFSFTYMDGGVFNNEPIREAYRMAAFIDSASSVNNEEYAKKSDRLILSVDPTTGTDNVPYTLPFHSEIDSYKAKWFKPFVSSKVRNKCTLSKLKALLPPVLGAFIDEGRVVEKDKIGATRKKFLYRENARSQVLKLPFHKMEQAELTKTALEVWKFCASRLEHEFYNELIPLGTLTINSELKRILAEHKDMFTAQEVKTLTSCSFVTENTTLTTIPDCMQKDKKLLAAFVKLLYCVAIDLLMELEGKPKGQKMVSIAPWDLRYEGDQIVQERIELPADELAAFAGFISEIANKATVPAAEMCTRKYLFHSGLLAMAAESTVAATMEQKYSPNFTIKSVRNEIVDEGEALVNRVRSVIKHSPLLENWPFPIGAGGRLLGRNSAAKNIKAMLLDIPPSKSITARLIVSKNSDLYLGRANYVSGRLYGLHPVNSEDGTYYLPLELKYRPPKYDMQHGDWSGDFIAKGGDGIAVCKLNLFNAEAMAPIPFPSLEMINQATYYPGYYLKYDLTKDETIRNSNHWCIVASGYEPLENRLVMRL